MYVRGIRSLFRFPGFVVSQISMTNGFVQVNFRRDGRYRLACPACGATMGANRANLQTARDLPLGTASELLPRVHQVVSLLKRLLLGTLHGSVSPDHLDYYLDEFAFRFNRRTSAFRGKLFYRLVQQAVQVPPAPYRTIISPPPVVGG